MKIRGISKMVPCSNCGKSINQEENFCKYCGTKQKRDIEISENSMLERNINSLLGFDWKNAMKDLYIIEFLQSVIRTSNIGVLIYIVMNLLLLTIICEIPTNGNLLLSFTYAILVYGIWLMIAISPIGEWILRFQTGCKELKREDQKELLEPVFYKTLAKARKLNPAIPEDVKLYISKDKSQNAFATGRRTICITEGMFSVSAEELKAVLGHEFGHIAHHDTDLILLISVGNLMISFFFTIVNLLVKGISGALQILGYIIPGGFVLSIGTWICEKILSMGTFLFAFLWTRIGIILTMHSSRSNEFEADEFSYRLGFGYGLCTFFDRDRDEGDMQGLFANLISSHPDSNLRIARLQSLGVEYRVRN